MSKIHLQTHENGFTCCGPNNFWEREKTTDPEKVTCLKGLRQLGRAFIPYGRKSWPKRLSLESRVVIILEGIKPMTGAESRPFAQKIMRLFYRWNHEKKKRAKAQAEEGK